MTNCLYCGREMVEGAGWVCRTCLEAFKKQKGAAAEKIGLHSGAIDEEFSCSECANAGSELCRECSYTVTASGKKKKPKLFISKLKRLPPGGIEALPMSGEELETYLELFCNIDTLLEEQRPIPFVMVAKYNEIIEKYGDYR